ncbi:hypothetical protein AB4865_03255 [Capnocytophaga sp. ARDL2]|uniref:hypothetical protein n=1 Tax=Capnocytophaga sp. ARDL2 TaxID=3238809 RepID=UPI00355741B1
MKRNIGEVYVPINRVADMGTTIGSAFRVEPLFVGSNSNITSNNAKNLNAYIELNLQW